MEGVGDCILLSAAAGRELPLHSISNPRGAGVQPTVDMLRRRAVAQAVAAAGSAPRTGFDTGGMTDAQQTLRQWTEPRQ